MKMSRVCLAILLVVAVIALSSCAATGSNGSASANAALTARVAQLENELIAANAAKQQAYYELSDLRNRVKTLGTPFVGISWRTATGRPEVATIIARGPAQAAGIIAGCTITHVGGVQVLTIAEFTRELQKYGPADVVSIRFELGNQSRQVELTLGVRTPY